MYIDLNKNRHHKIKSDYGLRDYYRYYRSIHNSKYAKTYSAYTKILRECNNKIRDAISDEAYDFKIPNRLGIIKVRKFVKSVRIDENGKLKHSMAPNWIETMKLWDSDPEARENRTKIFHDNQHSGGYTYKIVYSKKNANYKNKTAYRLRPNRMLCRKLSKNIKEHNLDTFLINS